MSNARDAKGCGLGGGVGAYPAKDEGCEGRGSEGAGRVA